MKLKSKILLIGILILLIFGCVAYSMTNTTKDEPIIAYVVNTENQDLQLYWKDDKGKLFGSIENLKLNLESRNKTLLFATNGGMYMEDHKPLGLFIQNSKTITSLNTADASGNFYLKPNGVFYLSKDKKAQVCQTSDFKNDSSIQFATQSGPMLVIDGQLHNAFVQGSKNLNIRNGVGILPDNRVVFAMSKDKINFYDFAKYFQDLGCKNALYLDGFVSRTYLPEKNWVQTDGNFGVIIGVIK
jgi:uncharacterized protein YigE (DUF2233 family)